MLHAIPMVFVTPYWRCNLSLSPDSTPGASRVTEHRVSSSLDIGGNQCGVHRSSVELTDVRNREDACWCAVRCSHQNVLIASYGTPLFSVLRKWRPSKRTSLRKTCGMCESNRLHGTPRAHIPTVFDHPHSVMTLMRHHLPYWRWCSMNAARYTLLKLS